MNWKRSLSFLICIVILVGSCVSFTAAGAGSLNQQKDYLSSQLETQKKEQQRLAGLLAEAKKKANNQLYTLQILYDEMNSYQDQINTISSLIMEYTELARAKENEIDELNAKIDKNFKLFKERLVFAQESGNISYIDFILGSADLSDIISRAEVINDMLEYDRKILEELVSDREAVEKAKSEIDLALKSSEEKYDEYEALLEIQKQKQAEAQAQLAELQNDQKKLQEAYNIAANEKKKIEDDLQSVIKQIAAQSVAKPGPTGFIWPLSPAYPGYVSWNFIPGGGHNGMDIAVGGWAYNGRIPALAIAGGKVVGRTSHWSWGNYVLIDHGGGYISRYAHLDSFSVSLGQTVSQGQQVGMIGSTGNSSGPHLHLEIYAPVGKNGASVVVNPAQYVIKP